MPSRICTPSQEGATRTRTIVLTLALAVGLGAARSLPARAQPSVLAYEHTPEDKSGAVAEHAPPSLAFARQHLVVGDRHYIATQQLPNTLMPALPFRGALCAGRGYGAFCTELIEFGMPDKWHLWACLYDDWGNALHNDVNLVVDFVGGFDILGTAPTVTGSWHLWYDGAEVTARGVGWDGDFATPAILVDDEHYIDGRMLIASNDDMVAMLLTMEKPRRNPRIIDLDLYLRYCSLGGEVLSPLVRLAETNLAEYEASLAMLPDGALVTGYLRRGAVGPANAVLQRVEPDYLVQDAVVIAENVEHVQMNVMHDGTIAAIWRETPLGSAAFAGRFDAVTLEPLGEAVLIDPTYHGGAIGRNGDIVLYRAELGVANPQVRVYDTEWQAVGDWFEPTIEPALRSRNLTPVWNPIDVGDNGSIWLAYYGYGDGGYGVAFGLNTLTPFVPGDMNLDGFINNFDIDPFILALSDPGAYWQTYPGAPFEFLGDLNFDGDFNNFDIDPFVEALTGR